MTDGNAISARVAIPSELPGGLSAARSGHFGRCECFTVVDLVDGEIAGVATLTNAEHVEGGCMTPVIALAHHGVQAVVVDGIGGRPLQGCQQIGIAVYAGVGDDVASAVHGFAAGRLPLVDFDGVCRH
jgi:predicted Fe-Mo cluster-binding NifX family protein